jgi:hypothetical protein
MTKSFHLIIHFLTNIIDTKVVIIGHVKYKVYVSAPGVSRKGCVFSTN